MGQAEDKAGTGVCVTGGCNGRRPADHLACGRDRDPAFRRRAGGPLRAGNWTDDELRAGDDGDTEAGRRSRIGTTATARSPI